ncbi:hypothetical protein CDL15_Pgr022316 [Punica granatum]|uniref:Uncharacterized protein n=1 Tax=Punica granatum TaxID=22663 RepID=A0A218W3R2_PUNGR|nr:hypothetical protein CDL15_Pgr022316 [Punica granatum]
MSTFFLVRQTESHTGTMNISFANPPPRRPRNQTSSDTMLLQQLSRMVRIRISGVPQ